MELITRNAHTALQTFLKIFERGTRWAQGTYVHDDNDNHCRFRRSPSRCGPVLAVEGPVTVTYERPTERAIFAPDRNANPFFHLYEPLWMLAGRNDVKPLENYIRRFVEFSDDGKTLNGAYGYRWRKAIKSNRAYESEESDRLVSYPRPVFVDQLDIIVDHLTRMPDSRRAVLQMWNVEDDLMKIGSDLDFMQGMESRDVCCNTEVMFSLRPYGDVTKHWDAAELWGRRGRFLDITVVNRSNDLLWGLLGPDYCVFSVLQEYIAARLNTAEEEVRPGLYRHFTNNLHAYIEREDWKPLETLASFQEYPEKQRPVPLVEDAARFERELGDFVQAFSGELPGQGRQKLEANYWREPYFQSVAGPVLAALDAHRHGWKATRDGVLANCLDPFQHRMAEEWFKRRNS